MKKFVSIFLSLIICCGFCISSAAQNYEEHVHSFECISVSEDYHTYACECGEILTEDHTFTDWQSNNDNGLFTSGTRTAVCTGCGFEKTERVIGSSVFFHPFFELYYVLKDFVISIIDRLI